MKNICKWLARAFHIVNRLDRWLRCVKKWNFDWYQTWVHIQSGQNKSVHCNSNYILFVLNSNPMSILHIFTCISRQAFPIPYLSGCIIGFSPLKWLQKTTSALQNFDIIQVLPLLNNTKGLNLSYKTDLDFGEFWKGKKLSYNWRDMVCFRVNGTLSGEKAETLPNFVFAF